MNNVVKLKTPKKDWPLFKYVMAVVFAVLIVNAITEMKDGRPPLHRKHNVRLLEPSISVSDAKIQTMDGKEMTIGDFKGDLTVLAFWAPWCGICASEFPDMDRQVIALKNKGIDVLAIVHAKESVDDIKRFYQRAELQNMSPYRSDDNSLFHRLGIRGYPSLFIADDQGRVFAAFRPEWGDDDVIDLLDGLIVREDAL